MGGERGGLRGDWRNVAGFEMGKGERQVRAAAAEDGTGRVPEALQHHNDGGRHASPLPAAAGVAHDGAGQGLPAGQAPSLRMPQAGAPGRPVPGEGPRQCGRPAFPGRRQVPGRSLPPRPGEPPTLPPDTAGKGDARVHESCVGHSPYPNASCACV